ncbi:MAG: CoA transferase [Chloroflexi bacterium]|nr:MAG: CoA transferase [Chloroflexota bacterium]
MADRALPLAGVRVLDCSRVLAGPFATMLLADLGADVVKLEPPTGDESRDWGPPFWGDPAERISAYFAAVNRNKRSIVADLGTDGGRELLDLLASRSDLLMHNARPASAERLGLGGGRLAERHPDLVVAVVDGFAIAGENAERPAYDLLAQAVTGLMAVTGEPLGTPMKVGVALLDLLAGLEVAVGALAGLLAAERQGRRLGQGSRIDEVRGSRFDVALVEAGVASLINVLGNLVATGEEPMRYGNAHPNIVPYEVFATADGHVAIAVGNDRQFARLISTLDLDPDDRFATNAGRVAHRAELIPILAGAIAARRRDELVGALIATDVPAGPVNLVSEALAMMQATAGGAWLQDAGQTRLAPNPIWVNRERLPAREAPPRLGEHTDAVLLEAGLDAGQIAHLRASGVVA